MFRQRLSLALFHATWVVKCPFPPPPQSAFVPAEGIFIAEPVGAEGTPLHSIVEPTATWEQLWAELGKKGKRVALMRGTAQCGKTSFAHRAAFYAKRKLSPFEDVCVHLVQDVAEALKWVNDRHTLGLDEKTLIIFDEAHAWFAKVAAQDLLNRVLKDVVSCRVVFLTTSVLGDHKLLNNTPKELKDRQYWFFGPSIDESSVTQYIAKCLAGKFTEHTRKTLTRSLFRMCGNNIALVSVVLQQAHSDPANFRLSPLLTFDCRILGGGNGDWGPEEVAVMREIAAVGFKEIAFATATATIQNLIRKGQIAPTATKLVVGAAAFQTFARDEQQLFSFTHAFQAERVGIILAAPHTTVHAVPKSAAECFVFALPFMPAVSFRQSEGDTSTLQEAPLQHGFSNALHRAQIAFVPEAALRDPTTRKKGHPFTVDFIIHPAGIVGGVAIEFLSDGEKHKTSLAKHVGRFQLQGGTYKLFVEPGRHLVVSWQIIDNAEPLGPSCCIVTPHPQRGWNVFCLRWNIDGSEKTLLVPRIAVPVDTNGVPARTYSPDAPRVVWVRIVPKDDPTKASKATAFRVTPAIADMDGLKDAVKAKMSNTLKDVDAVMLKVYAHDAATGGWVEVTKASTPLAPNDEETAYHVVVGS